MMFWFSFLVIWSISSKGFADLLNTKDATIIANYQQNVFISFSTNFTTNDNRELKTFYVELPPSTQQIVFGNKEQLTITSQSPFKNRLNGNVTDNTYLLEVSNLQYSDEYLFRGFLLYNKDKDLDNILAESKDVQLLVKGGPNLCGNALSSITLLNTSSTNVINVTLCGNQKPIILWRLDGKEITTQSSNSTNNFKEYVYKLNMVKPDPSVCGKTLSFLATGYASDLSGSTKLDLIFKPSVSVQASTKNSTCIDINWQYIDIGNCTDLQYEVQLVYTNQSIFKSAIVNHMISSYSYCVSNASEIEFVMSAKLRGIFKTNIGSWIQKNLTIVTVVTTPPPTTSTASPKTDQSSNTDDNEDLYIYLGAGGGGLLFILLIILIICCCCCRRKKSEKSENFQTESIHEYNYQKATNGKLTYQHTNQSNITTQSNNSTPKVQNGNGAPNQSYETQFTELNNEPRHENLQADDSDSNMEFVSVAKLKYYDPNEFDTDSNTSNDNQNQDINNTTNVSPYAPLPNKLAQDHVNPSYENDTAVDSDDSVEYENFNRHYRANEHQDEINV